MELMPEAMRSGGMATARGVRHLHYRREFHMLKRDCCVGLLSRRPVTVAMNTDKLRRFRRRSFLRWLGLVGGHDLLAALRREAIKLKMALVDGWVVLHDTTIMPQYIVWAARRLRRE